MKRLAKNFALFTAVTAIGGLLPACSCGDDDDNGNTNPDANAIDAPGIDADLNAFPTLGTQIDRSGRPAISTALIKSMIYPDAADQAALKDQYNSDDDPSTWVADYQAEMELNLGILDSLDNGNPVGVDNGCGNQFLHDGVNDTYAPLAGALANDVLVINAAEATCEQYLAVEAGVAGDCGGRTPNMDVVDVSYGVLVAGPAAIAGIPDNVPAPVLDIATFPFLATPLLGQ